MHIYLQKEGENTLGKTCTDQTSLFTLQVSFRFAIPQAPSHPCPSSCKERPLSSHNKGNSKKKKGMQEIIYAHGEKLAQEEQNENVTRVFWLFFRTFQWSFLGETFVFANRSALLNTYPTNL